MFSLVNPHGDLIKRTSSELFNMFTTGISEAMKTPKTSKNSTLIPIEKSEK
jgi:hypothetical protein